MEDLPCVSSLPAEVTALDGVAGQRREALELGACEPVNVAVSDSAWPSPSSDDPS